MAWLWRFLSRFSPEEKRREISRMGGIVCWRGCRGGPDSNLPLPPDMGGEGRGEGGIKPRT